MRFKPQVRIPPEAHDDLDDLLQLGWREPGDNLVHVPLGEQANGCNNRLGYTLGGAGGGPTERRIVQCDSVR